VADGEDNKERIYPGATEFPDDGIDQDCNGSDAITCFVDFDQDGYGTDQGTTVIVEDGSCDTMDNESDNMTDCDDTNDMINPGATEIPDDGIDQDCDGSDATCCIPPIRGDATMNGLPGQIEESIDIADLVYMVNFMFKEGPEPTCWPESNVNDIGADDDIDIADLVYLVNYMFKEGPNPLPCP